MNKRSTVAVFTIIGILVIGAVGWAAWNAFHTSPQTSSLDNNPPIGADDTTKVRSVVDAFGKALQNVSLTASTSTIATNIRTTYAPYLTPDLLNDWANDPSHAIGRLTSSPWPDHIQIDTVTQNSLTSYAVTGKIIEITSVEQQNGGVADSRDISLTLENTSGQWLISAVSTESGDDNGNSGQTSLKTYTQPGLFTIQYPSDWKVDTGSGLGGAYLDNTLVKITSPQGAFNASGTNFNEAYVVISTSSDTSSCTSFSDIPNATSPDKTQTVNGVTFHERDAADAAAGNRYNSRVYRMTYAGYCGEAVLTVHTGAIGNYPPGVTEFDQSVAFNALEQILNTLTFSAKM